MRAAATSADLFDVPPLPGGLGYQADFLTQDEEAATIAAIGALQLREAKFQQYTARRRVVRFGLVYDADLRRWIDGDALPGWLCRLRRKVAADRCIGERDFIHALVTEYRPGTPIGWHRDKPEYGIVAGISLAGACRMRFRRIDAPRDRTAAIAVELAPRSLYVMSDDIRWRWQHSIAAVKALRYSVTFRTRA